MENKNPKFELEPNRKVYFQLGLFIVGAAVLMAFSYKTPVYLNEKEFIIQMADLPIELIEKEEQPIIEIPKVEKLPKEEFSTPLLPLDFLNNIKKTKSSDVDPKLVVSAKGVDPYIVAPFDIDAGAAPKGVVVKYPDIDAQFQGSWTAYLGGELKYPEESVFFKESGTAWVSFVVEIDGSVTDVEVMNRSLPKSLQKEAIRVVKTSPRWTPGSKNGEKVRSTKVVKINFILK
ncbi:MAG TPA: energy transducer TonB [Brumimicrobium sp.]|nr:energy transducer TonB [Brumimicrobium sp.]